MSLQYIFDHKGEVTGVYIPIKTWDKLKTKYKGLQENASAPLKLSSKQKKAIEEGLEDIKKGRVKSHDEVMAKMKKKYPKAFRK